MLKSLLASARPRSAVGNVSGYRCVSDCRSRGPEFDPGLVPFFRGDWSWNNLCGHSPPFCWFIQEGLLLVTSESMCTNYLLTACSSLPRKVWLGDLTVRPWPLLLTWDVKQQYKQTNLLARVFCWYTKQIFNFRPRSGPTKHQASSVVYSTVRLWKYSTHLNETTCRVKHRKINFWSISRILVKSA